MYRIARKARRQALIVFPGLRFSLEDRRGPHHLLMLDLSRPAMLGIAGDIRPANETGIACGVAGLQIGTFRPPLGSFTSARLGERAARHSPGRALFLSDFCYLVALDRSTGKLRWSNRRAELFAHDVRQHPLLLDSSGYRRCMSGTAPRWATLERYVEAIELIRPDGYAAWDDPTDRHESERALATLEALIPDDAGRWPVFSARWVSPQGLSLNGLPAAWASYDRLECLIPLNRTQRHYTAGQREQWARAAIAYGLAIGADPLFQRMAARYGRVMIGGLVRFSGVHRLARHLIAATLHALYPDVHIWLLGQASFAVINGLGMLGLLDYVYSDGSWWWQDGRADQIAYVERGLLTMLSLAGTKPDIRDANRPQTFFTLTEICAANLRALLAAYAGVISWPSVPPPDDPRDQQQLRAYRNACLPLQNAE